MKKLRWGVLSTADIGMSLVIPAMQQGQHCEMVGIASRDLGKARQAAKRLGIPKAFGSYEELLADADIEAIYNPLPNHLHVPWSIKALEAGKHVLCEKPISITVSEGEELLAAARQHPSLKVMEAFMYRFHPQWQRARQLVLDGQIGELRAIQTLFSYYNTDPHNVRNQADIGGGGLLDIGCYCISLSRFIFGGEPRRVFGIMDIDPVLQIDRLASGIMDFGSSPRDSSAQRLSAWTCSTQLVPHQNVRILGTEGHVEIEIPFNAPIDRPCRMWHERKGRTKEIVLPICNQYTIQGDLFSVAVLNDMVVPTPLEDAVANMRVIEAIVRSHQTGAWVSP
jgi:predicted dehydrogenase